ncbi:hypothetical protein J5U23_01683 [Saccharolobus shibatae B12]|uniref:Uncharacterized protein n=1 Tax=Saccharolobus shibatae (strain ATCC 51178 / DSM 5389 / JCM 8931 / NBRC 15437 / B12) TaxID=523848 RepID=A0A8F5GTC7_SACSH|nr:hypothetical protein J5U23_01683 [Saccharolobus shibatae B12]
MEAILYFQFLLGLFATTKRVDAIKRLLYFQFLLGLFTVLVMLR